MPNFVFSVIINAVITVVNCAFLVKCVYEYLSKSPELLNKINNLIHYYYSYKEDILEFGNYISLSINKYQLIKKTNQLASLASINNSEKIFDIVLVNEKGNVVFNQSIYSINPFVKAVVVINAHPISSSTSLSSVSIDLSTVSHNVESLIKPLESQHVYGYSIRVYTDDDSSYIVKNDKLFDSFDCNITHTNTFLAASLNLIVNNVNHCKTKVYDVINCQDRNYYCLDDLNTDVLQKFHDKSSTPECITKGNMFIDYLKNITEFIGTPDDNSNDKYSKLLKSVKSSDKQPIIFKNDLDVSLYALRSNSTKLEHDSGFGWNITNQIPQIVCSSNTYSKMLSNISELENIHINSKLQYSTGDINIFNSFHEMSFALDQSICHKSDLMYGGEIDKNNNNVNINKNNAGIICKGGIYKTSKTHDKYLCFEITLEDNNQVKLEDIIKNEYIELHDLLTHYNIIKNIKNYEKITIKPIHGFLVTNLIDIKYNNLLKVKIINNVYNLSFNVDVVRKNGTTDEVVSLNVSPELSRSNKYNLIDDDNGIVMSDALVKFYIKYLSNKLKDDDNDMKLMSMSYNPSMFSVPIVKHFSQKSI